MIKYFRCQELPSGDIALFVGDDEDVSFENYTEYKISSISHDDDLYQRFLSWAGCGAWEVHELAQALMPLRVGGFLFEPLQTVRTRNLTLNAIGQVHMKSDFEEVRGRVTRVEGVVPLQDELDEFKSVYP